MDRQDTNADLSKSLPAQPGVLKQRLPIRVSSCVGQRRQGPYTITSAQPLAGESTPKRAGSQRASQADAQRLWINCAPCI